MESRYRLQRLLILKWLCYFGVLLLGTALQTMPAFSIGQAKPVFILPICMAVACIEDPFQGAWFGIIGGLLWDWTAGRVPGLLAIGVAWVCFFAGITVVLILRVNHMNFILLALAGTWIVVSMDFVFNYLMRRYSYPEVEYIVRVLPIVVFTAAISPVCMILLKKIQFKFQPEE